MPSQDLAVEPFDRAGRLLVYVRFASRWRYCSIHRHTWNTHSTTDAVTLSILWQDTKKPVGLSRVSMNEEAGSMSIYIRIVASLRCFQSFHSSTSTVSVEDHRRAY